MKTKKILYMIGTAVTSLLLVITTIIFLTDNNYQFSKVFARSDLNRSNLLLLSDDITSALHVREQDIFCGSIMTAKFDAKGMVIDLNFTFIDIISGREYQVQKNDNFFSIIYIGLNNDEIPNKINLSHMLNYLTLINGAENEFNVRFEWESHNGITYLPDVNQFVFESGKFIAVNSNMSNMKFSVIKQFFANDFLNTTLYFV